MLDDHTQDDIWKSTMNGIKNSVNERLWDPAQNLFFDNDHNQTSNAIHPQDGNSWVIIANLVDAERAAAISTALMDRWVKPYGAPAPEAGATISPFATGFERYKLISSLDSRIEPLISLSSCGLTSCWTIHA